MLKNIHINDIGKGGLVSSGDYPSFEIPGESINEGDSFRFNTGVLTRQPGYVKLNFNLTGTPFDGFRFYTGTVLDTYKSKGMIFLLYKPGVTPFSGETPTPHSVIAEIKLAFWDGKNTYQLRDISPYPNDINILKQPQLFSFLGTVYLNTQSSAPYYYNAWETSTESKQVTKFTAIADVSGNLNGKYITIYDSKTTSINYYMDVNNTGVAPPYGATRNVKISLSTNASASTIATAFKTAIDSDPNLTATVSGSDFTVTNDIIGQMPDHLVKAPGFSILVIETGKVGWPIFRQFDTTPITGTFPPDTSINYMCAFKNHLIGVGSVVVSTSKEQPYKVMWSNVISDPGTEPSWNTSETNLAGSTILPDTYGNSFTAVPMGDNLIIYTLTSTFRLYKIELPLVFGLEKIFANIGCVGPNCVQEFNGSHFIANANGVYTHNGTSVQNKSDGVVSKLISDYIGQYDSISVFHNIITKEMYLYFESTIQTEVAKIFSDKMLIFNYATDQWSKGYSPYASRIIPAVAFNISVQWNNVGTRPYNGGFSISSDYESLKRKTANWTFFYFSQMDNSYVYQNTANNYLRDGSIYQFMIRRDFLDVYTISGDENGQKDQDFQKYIYEMIIYMAGSGQITVEISSSMNIAGPTKAFPPIIIDLDPAAAFEEVYLPNNADTAIPMKPYKIDIRATGRYISYQITKNDAGDARIKSIQFKMKTRGLR
jgi:hypothetical protein